MLRVSLSFCWLTPALLVVDLASSSSVLYVMVTWMPGCLVPQCIGSTLNSCSRYLHAPLLHPAQCMTQGVVMLFVHMSWTIVYLLYGCMSVCLAQQQAHQRLFVTCKHSLSGVACTHTMAHAVIYMYSVASFTLQGIDSANREPYCVPQEYS